MVHPTCYPFHPTCYPLPPHVLSLNFIFQENLTALMIAVKVNNVEMVELLVKSGASIDVADSENLSPIHW